MKTPFQRADARVARSASKEHGFSVGEPEKDRLYLAPYRKAKQKVNYFTLGKGFGALVARY